MTDTLTALLMQQNSSVQSLMGNVAVSQEILGRLEAEIAKVSSELSLLQGRLASLETAHPAAGARMSEIEEGLTLEIRGLEAALKELESSGSLPPSVSGTPPDILAPAWHRFAASVLEAGSGIAENKFTAAAAALVLSVLAGLAMLLIAAGTGVDLTEVYALLPWGDGEALALPTPEEGPGE